VGPARDPPCRPCNWGQSRRRRAESPRVAP
jgi:hypothetical protein